MRKSLNVFEANGKLALKRVVNFAPVTCTMKKARATGQNVSKLEQLLVTNLIAAPQWCVAPSVVTPHQVSLLGDWH